MILLPSSSLSSSLFTKVVGLLLLVVVLLQTQIAPCNGLAFWNQPQKIQHSSSKQQQQQQVENNIHIQVCQNKHCCRNYQGSFSLLQTLRDLFIVNTTAAGDGTSSSSYDPITSTTITMERSGCLSQCEKGPNIALTIQRQRRPRGQKQQPQQQDPPPKEVILFGIRDASTVAATIELALEEEQQEYQQQKQEQQQNNQKNNPNNNNNNNHKDHMDNDVTTTTGTSTIQIPPTLLAAVNVLEKSQQSGISFQQGEKYFNSVIQTLQNSNEFSNSMALAHAYSLRSQFYYDQYKQIHGEMTTTKLIDEHTHDNDDHLLDLAYQDAKTSIEMDKATTIFSTPWRIVSDIDIQRNNVSNAIQTLQQWGNCQPSFRTKINQEIQQLLQEHNKNH